MGIGNDDGLSKADLLAELDQLRDRLAEAEQTIEAIRSGEVDALVVSGPQGEQVYTLTGADHVYRVIVETMQEAALTVRLDGMILFCNQQFCRLVKTPMQESIGHLLFQFTDAAQHPRLSAFLAVARVAPHRERLVLRTAAGTRIPLQLAGGPLPLDGNAAICLVASDLTQLEATADSIQVLLQQQLALEESEERCRRAALQASQQRDELDALLASAPAAILNLDERGRLANANPAAVALHGFEDFGEMQAHGPRLSDFCEGRDADGLLLPPEAWPCMRALSGEVIAGLEIAVRRRGTDKHWIGLYSARPIPNEDGTIRQVVMTIEDITERKRVEEELREAKRTLERRVQQRTGELARASLYARNLLEAGLDAMVIISPRGQITDVNRATEELTGFSRSDLVGSDFSNYFTAPERAREGYQRVMDAEQVRDLELTLRQASGATVDVLYNATVFRDEAGALLGVFAEVRDISEEKRLAAEAKVRQQQLVQADKMVSLGVLASGIAHEINNPNHAIMSNITSLSGVWDSIRPILDQFQADFGDFVLGGYDYSECRDKLPAMYRSVLDSAKRIDLIVSELRDFARSSPSEKMTPIEVNAVVQSAITLMNNLIQKATSHFQVHYGTELPPVVANHQRIEQVVINLVQNACQALEDRDKAVHLATSHDPERGMVLIEVRDEGVGIPEEAIEHLGDPFFTSKRDSGGMGLGLSISFSIAREHGGTLTFSSKPGEGTTAVLALPVAASRGEG